MERHSNKRAAYKGKWYLKIVMYYAEMYKNANLKGSQAIINVNVSYKNKYILIHNQSKAIATGTVIEFID